MSTRRRKPTTRQLRRFLWFKLHGTAPIVPCYWCGTELTFNTATVDHEPPLALGGKWYEAVIACESCNKARGLELQKQLGKK